MVQGKLQSSVLDIRIVQLTVLKVCFHLEVETGFVILPKMFNLQAQRTCQIASAAEALQPGVFPKGNLKGTETGLGIVV